jgi:hypothetical protein
MFRCFGIACTVALLSLVQAAADTHHNGQARLGNRIRQNGRQLIHNGRNGHQAHAHVNGGRIHRVEVSHRGKPLNVRKFKTARRQHALLHAADGAHYVMAEAEPTAEAQGFTLYVGFGFFNQVSNQWVIFWFPVNLVFGGDQGCTDFDSNTP